MAQYADRVALRVLASLAKSAGVGGVERTRPVIHPDVIMSVNVQPPNVTNNPIIRERFRPGGIDDEPWGGSSRAGFRRCSLRQPRQDTGLVQNVGGACRLRGRRFRLPGGTSRE